MKQNENLVQIQTLCVAEMPQMPSFGKILVGIQSVLCSKCTCILQYLVIKCTLVVHWLLWCIMRMNECTWKCSLWVPTSLQMAMPSNNALQWYRRQFWIQLIVLSGITNCHQRITKQADEHFCHLLDWSMKHCLVHRREHSAILLLKLFAHWAIFTQIDQSIKMISKLHIFCCNDGRNETLNELKQVLH